MFQAFLKPSFSPEKPIKNQRDQDFLNFLQQNKANATSYKTSYNDKLLLFEKVSEYN